MKLIFIHYLLITILILFLYQIYFNQILTLFLIKMKELTILLFCIIAMFVYMNYIRKSLHLSLIESSIDNQKYLVRNLKVCVKNYEFI